MSEPIDLSSPRFAGNEWTYLKDCLDTGWVSSVGPYVDRFERDVARYCGSAHAVACSSGTAALHVALQVVGVRRDDEVIVPTLTFIAPVNAVHYVGAHPVFMDADPYYNMDVAKLTAFIRQGTEFKEGHSYNKSTGRRVAAIVPVHVFGNAVDFGSVLDLLRERNIKIIEDATESLGTVYTEGPLKGRYAGTIGDIGCFSFNGNKIITCGGGGMIVTDQADLARRAKYLTTQAKEDGIYYVHGDVGYNYRLTNIQAALGVAQLEALPGYLEQKKSNFELYRRLLADVPGLSLVEPPGYAKSNYWMYALQVKDMESRDRLIGHLSAAKIQARPLWELNHRQKPYSHCQVHQVELALRLLERTVNIPCSVHLTKEQVGRVAACIREL